MLQPFALLIRAREPIQLASFGEETSPAVSGSETALFCYRIKLGEQNQSKKTAPVAVNATPNIYRQLCLVYSYAGIFQFCLNLVSAIM
jgi:hypothetical protein